LTLAHKRDEVTSDMMATFEEARTEARSRGAWNYFLFAAREISGLLGSPSRINRKSALTLIAGGGLVGLALGVAASHLWPAAYTSEAQLQIYPPEIPKNLLASGDALDLDNAISEVRFTLSRQIERNMAEFYPHLRAAKEVGALREEIIRRFA
jgi:uncharacterized protein involved in exopolysaccharide biosynthesis